MTDDTLPSPELLRKLLRYDPSTGKLFWRERPVDTFATEAAGKTWNKRFAETEAIACQNTNGYLTGTMFCKRHKAHRVIWALVNGEWPEGEIDHIDGNKLNNVIGNLRVVSSAENRRNMSRPKTNTSGVIGVDWCSVNHKWRARIKINRRRIHIGYFSNIDDAATARAEAEAKYGFHQNHGRDQ